MIKLLRAAILRSLGITKVVEDYEKVVHIIGEQQKALHIVLNEIDNLQKENDLLYKLIETLQPTQTFIN